MLNKVFKDPKKIRNVTEFFAWTAWVTTSNRPLPFRLYHLYHPGRF